MYVRIQTLFLADVIEPSSIVNNIYNNIYEDELSGVVHLQRQDDELQPWKTDDLVSPTFNSALFYWA